MTDPASQLAGFFTEIGILDQLAKARLEAALPDGLHANHFGVLNHLVRLGGTPSQADLARSFQVSRASMTNTVQKLTELGLVDIHVDAQDQRINRVHLTKAGARAQAQAWAALTPGFAQLLAVFPADEFAAAQPFLQRLREFMDAHRQA